MKRHPADLFSLLAGLAVLGVGLLMLAGDVGDLPMEWVGPAVAIALGLLIVVAARPEREANEEAQASTDEV